MNANELRERFEDLHKKGAERFGVDWLQVNNAAIAAANHVDVEYFDTEMKALLTEASWRFLLWYESKVKAVSDEI